MYEKIPRILFAVSLLLALSGCMPMAYPPGVKTKTAELREKVFLTEDGVGLPVRRWLPKERPHAVLVALHGFNDYSHFFALPGEYLSKQGIACFAYDQRGFGAAPKRGLWAGNDTYSHDLHVFTQLVRQRYPRQPIYLLGESMGGAIVITAMRQGLLSDVAGTILVAPALWARSTMPWYQTGLLWTLAHSMPWLTLTGKGLGVMASDNIEMLRALGKDPWVIKGTRVETLYGLTDLMDQAFNSALSLQGDILLLYGEKDEIIPKKPTALFLRQLLASDKAQETVAVYPNGYHMLLRDLQAHIAWGDIAAWIGGGQGRLPSGADNHGKQWLIGQWAGLQ